MFLLMAGYGDLLMQKPGTKGICYLVDFPRASIIWGNPVGDTAVPLAAVNGGGVEGRLALFASGRHEDARNGTKSRGASRAGTRNAA